MAENEDLNLISDLINPVENLKLQYTSPLAFFTYRSMRSKGNLAIQPFYLLDLVPWVRKHGTNLNWNKLMSEPTLGGFKNAGLGLISGKWGFNIEDSLGAMVPEKGAADLMATKIRDYTKRNLKKDFSSTDFISYLGNKTNGSAVASKFVASTVGQKSLIKIATRARTIMKIGAVGEGVVGFYFAGKMLADLSVGFFKGAVAASNYVASAREGIRNLEFGELGNGYMSKGAATERQAALQEMQNSHLNGSLFLTNEARNYANQI